MGGNKKYKQNVGWRKPQGKTLLERSRHRWENNIKINLS